MGFFTKSRSKLDNSKKNINSVNNANSPTEIKDVVSVAPPTEEAITERNDYENIRDLTVGENVGETIRDDISGQDYDITENEDKEDEVTAVTAKADVTTEGSDEKKEEEVVGKDNDKKIEEKEEETVGKDGEKSEVKETENEKINKKKIFDNIKLKSTSKSSKKKVTKEKKITENSALIQCLGLGVNEEPTSPSTLFADWDRFQETLQANPLEAKIKDSTGKYYVLELVLQNENTAIPYDIVETLLEATPQALKEEYIYNNTYNDYAENNPEAEKIIRLLHNTYIEGRFNNNREEVKNGAVLLTRAIDNGNVPAVSILIERYPKTIDIQDEKGLIMLHAVCSFVFLPDYHPDVRDKILSMIIYADNLRNYSENLAGGLLFGIGKSQTPFQCAMESIAKSIASQGGYKEDNEVQEQMWKSFDILVEMVEESYRKRDLKFPLFHHLLGFAGDLMNYVITRYDMDIYSIDDKGRNILMQVIDGQDTHPSYKISKEGTSCFVSLLQKNDHARRCINEPDKNGSYVIHYALNHIEDQEWTWNSGLKALYCTNPKVSNTLDAEGRTHLHMALDGGLSLENGLREIIQRVPDAAYTRDNRGRLPLHVAIQRGLTWKNGLYEVYSANPNACVQTDEEGVLPLPSLIEEKFLNLSEGAYDMMYGVCCGKS